MKTPLIQIVNKVNNAGWDVQPVKKNNGMFRVSVWHFDKLFKKGEKEYKTWEEAVNTTYINLFNTLKK